VTATGGKVLMCPECADEHKLQRKQEEVKCRNAELTKLIRFKNANKVFLIVAGIFYGIGVLTLPALGDSDSNMWIVTLIIMGIPTIPSALGFWKKAVENMPTSFVASTGETLFGDRKVTIKKDNTNKLLFGLISIIFTGFFSPIWTPVLMIKAGLRISKTQKRIRELQ